MLVKVIKVYFDKTIKRIMNPEEEFEVTKERASILLNAGVAEAVEVPKKKTTKKKVNEDE